MKRLIISLTGILFVISSAFGQDTRNAVERINQIKMSDGYLYAEATAVTWEEAQDNAISILKLMIDDWITLEGRNSSSQRLMDEMAVIQATRANLYRAFAYVKKGGSSEVKPAPTKKIVDAPKPERPVASTNVTAVEREEAKMLRVESIKQLELYIKGLRSKNLVKDYDKTTTAPDHDCYLFVYDRNGEIVSLLKITGNESISLKTGASEYMSNHPGCQAIWLTLKI